MKFGTFLLGSSLLQLGNAMSPPGITWAAGWTDGACESHAHAGVQTKDGGYLLVGDGECYDSRVDFKRQIVVAKVDGTGNLEWEQNVGTVGYNYGKNGIELSDGTFLVAGALSVGSEHSYSEQRVLLRFSQEGELLKTQVFDSVDAGKTDGFMGLALSPTGEVVATGYVGSTLDYPDAPMFLVGGGHAVLMKLQIPASTADNFGVAFEKVLNGTDVTAEFIPYQGMRLTADADGYTVVAASYLSSDDGQMTNWGLIRTDTEGAVQTLAYLPAADGPQSHPYALTAGSDNGYVIAGHTIRDVDGNDSPQGRIVKVSSTFEVDFDYSFSQERDGYSTECYGVSVARDGGYVVACGTGPEQDQSSEPWQNLVQRVDKSGNSLWKQIYTDNGKNGTGEYIVTDEVMGGYAVYMDSSCWGNGDTGGNFAIMHLDDDTSN